ncbi:MAG TPA: Ig-like domain repeat protein [Acidimicrobiales bacterium]|nr:Ig-like domain repeat protein [Acidimicrobiales bacterium]
MRSRKLSKVAGVCAALTMVAAPAVLVASPAWASGVFPNTASIGLQNPPGSVPEPASTYPSAITVSGQSGTISNLTVTLSGIDYPDGLPSDLGVLLVGPAGGKISLFTLAGGFGTSPTDLSVTLSDSGSTLTYDQSLAATGSVTVQPADFSSEVAGDGYTYDDYPSPAPSSFDKAAPTGTATFASTFDGTDPNGTWDLYVTTNTEGDGTGSISGGWSLDITTSAVEESTTTVLSSDQNPAFTSAPDNSVALTATVEASGTPVTEGTVDFTDGGTTISGCGAVAPDSSGQAACDTSFSTEGAHDLVATYSGFTGTTDYATSFGDLTEVVNDHTVVTNNGNTFTNEGPISIPNTTPTTATPYPSEIFVTGETGTISHLSVTLSGITYPYTSALDVLLVGPAGTAAGSEILLSGVGEHTGTTGASDVTVTFDDNSATTLAEQAPLGGTGASVETKPVDYPGVDTDVFPGPAPSGTYGTPAPRGTSTLGEVFDATSPDGTWALYVTTQEGDGTGSIAGGWSLTFTTGSETATTTTVSDSPNPSFTAAPDNSVELTATVESSGSPVTAGTVEFTAGGTTIAGCGAVALNSSGQGQCPTSFSAQADVAVQAIYSGTASYATSDGSTVQVVEQHTTVGPANVFANTGAITLNNPTSSAPEQATPYPSDIFTSNLGPVSGLTVTLDGISYPYSQDLEALLVGPQGQSMVLFSNVGPDTGTTDASNVTVTFSDAASSAIPQSTPLGSPGSSVTTKPVDYSGSDATTFPAPAPASGYSLAAPEGSSTLGGLFGGTNPDGTWSLYVLTNGEGDGLSCGTCEVAGGWSIDFTVATQTVTFSTTPPSPGVAGTTYDASATASSGLPITYSVDASSTAGACSVDSTTGVVSFLAAGTCVLDADQAGDGNYDSATKSQTIDVVSPPGAPTGLSATPGNGQVSLSWSAPTSDGGSPITSYNVYEGTSSGGETLFAITSGTTYPVTGLSNGTKYYFEVTALNGVGEGPDSNEAFATPEGLAQSIIFTSSPPTYGATRETAMGEKYTPTARATSGLLVSFKIDGSSSTGACSIAGSVVTFTGPGTCVIDANQAGNTQYAPAAQVQQKVTVHSVANVIARLSAPASAAAGSDITYTLKVSDEGPGPASSIAVTLFLPGGVSLVSASGNPSSKDFLDVQWTSVSIAAGSSVTYTVVVKVEPGVSGTLFALGWAYQEPGGSLSPNPLGSLSLVGTDVPPVRR